MAELEPPDELLVLAAILGDFDAFNELVLRYRAAVVRVARAIVGANDAEDVAQDSFLLAFKALSSIDDPARFAAWLSAITRHRALRLKKHARDEQVRHVALDELLVEKVEALSARSFDDNAQEEVLRALEKLPEQYALIMKLRFLDNMPVKRIAAFLGIPISTIKWRLHHGKKLLREEVKMLGDKS